MFGLRQQFDHSASHCWPLHISWVNTGNYSKSGALCWCLVLLCDVVAKYQFPASHTDTIHLCSAWTGLRLLNSIKMINQAKLVQKQSLVWDCKYLDSALRKVVAIAGWWIDINCTLLVFFFLVFFASGEWIHRYHAGYHFPLLSSVTTAWSFLSSLKILTPFSRMISNYFLLIICACVAGRCEHRVAKFGEREAVTFSWPGCQILGAKYSNGEQLSSRIYVSNLE